VNAIKSDDAIELLSEDDDGNAVPGPIYPANLGVAKYWSGESDEPGHGVRLAYLHKFFKYDRHGQPMAETLVRFYVPDYLCDGASPSPRALRLVAQRMGWDK
jgi:hypothetical protein